ncbi:MAG: hypothetical protein M5U28_01070 [Sandaracinaceae bacterium]|nr:hypothetical protein [Sandaracinaceae bacterium]
MNGVHSSPRSSTVSPRSSAWPRVTIPRCCPSAQTGIVPAGSSALVGASRSPRGCCERSTAASVGSVGSATGRVPALLAHPTTRATHAPVHLQLRTIILPYL